LREEKGGAYEEIHYDCYPYIRAGSHAIQILCCRCRPDLYGPPCRGYHRAAVGYLTTFFADNPADHYNNNVAIGAGIGFVAGLALGISGSLKTSASFYQRDTNREKLYGLSINIPLK